MRMAASPAVVAPTHVSSLATAGLVHGAPGNLAGLLMQTSIALLVISATMFVQPQRGRRERQLPTTRLETHSNPQPHARRRSIYAPCSNSGLGRGPSHAMWHGGQEARPAWVCAPCRPLAQALDVHEGHKTRTRFLNERGIFFYRVSSVGVSTSSDTAAGAAPCRIYAAEVHRHGPPQATTPAYRLLSDAR